MNARNSYLVCLAVLTALAVPTPCRANLLAMAGSGGPITEYAETTGAKIRQVVGSSELGNLSSAFAVGSDGLVYVVDGFTKDVRRYDYATGNFVDVFAVTSQNMPADIEFGPDGKLYLLGVLSPYIEVFDGATGGLLGQLPVNVQDPGWRTGDDMTFSDAGEMFVLTDDAIVRFDFSSGTPQSTALTPTGLPGLAFYTAIDMAPNGNLLVGVISDGIYEIDAMTGDNLGAVILASDYPSLSSFRSFEVGSDGILYLPLPYGNSVSRFDLNTNAMLPPLAPIQLGLDGKIRLLNVPEPSGASSVLVIVATLGVAAICRGVSRCP